MNYQLEQITTVNVGEDVKSLTFQTSTDDKIEHIKRFTLDGKYLASGYETLVNKDDNRQVILKPYQFFKDIDGKVGNDIPSSLTLNV